MKNTDIKKLQEKNEADLIKELNEEKENLRSMKFDLASGKVKNVTLIKKSKRKIARILTTINQKKNGTK